MTDLVARLEAVKNGWINDPWFLFWGKPIREVEALLADYAKAGMQEGLVRCKRCGETLTTWALCKDCSDDKATTTVRLRLQEYKATRPAPGRPAGLREALSNLVYRIDEWWPGLVTETTRQSTDLGEAIVIAKSALGTLTPLTPPAREEAARVGIHNEIARRFSGPEGDAAAEETKRRMNAPSPPEAVRRCPKCDGIGHLRDHGYATCTKCKGTGVVKDAGRNHP